MGLSPTLTYAAPHRFRFPVDFMGRTFLYVLLLIALPAAAQIYKYTDANGNTVYSDHSPDGVKAQPVELPPLNRVEPQRTERTGAAPAPTHANGSQCL